jgi:hypothetical protein
MEDPEAAVLPGRCKTKTIVVENSQNFYEDRKLFLRPLTYRDVHDLFEKYEACADLEIKQSKKGCYTDVACPKGCDPVILLPSKESFPSDVAVPECAAMLVKKKKPERALPEDCVVRFMYTTNLDDYDPNEPRVFTLNFKELVRAPKPEPEPEPQPVAAELRSELVRPEDGDGDWKGDVPANCGIGGCKIQ